MSDAPSERPKATVSVAAVVAYCILTGLVCGGIGAWVPSWVIIQITAVENAASAQRWTSAQQMRRDSRGIMVQGFKDETDLIKSACRTK